jgi:hypothetical protein
VACERASLTEKLATMRTKQMFMDLDEHCKQQVNFDMIEKIKLLNYTDLFSSAQVKTSFTSGLGQCLLTGTTRVGLFYGWGFFGFD